MTKFSVKKHLKRYHATSKAFFCELCSEGFQRPDLRTHHMEVVHHDSFRCFHCNLQFYMSSSYVEHMQDKHGLVIRVLTSKNKSEVDVPLDRLRFLPQKLDNDVSYSKNISQTFHNFKKGSNFSKIAQFYQIFNSLKFVQSFQNLFEFFKISPVFQKTSIYFKLFKNTITFQTV